MKASPVRASDVKAAREVVLYDLDRGFFLARYDRAAPLEKAYMRIMADAPSLPARSGDIVLRQKKLSANALSTTRDRLIHKGLIYSPRHGEVDFTVPGFAAFLRRNQTL